MFLAVIESAELPQALVKSDTKWLNNLFLCDTFQNIFPASSLILKHLFFFLVVFVVLNSPHYATAYISL